MSYHFDTLRAIQAVAVLLKESGGRHNYTSVLKMLYLADRDSIKRVGSPITGDRPYAMDNGPVLSRIYDLIKGADDDEETQATWSKYIRRDGFDVELLLDPGEEKLSEFEVETLREIFAQNGNKRLFELIQDSHDLPEWEESYIGEGTSREIHLKTLLRALGMEDRYEELSTAKIEDAHFAKLFG